MTGLRVGFVAAAAVLGIAGCSSSGGAGGGVSTSQLESKLKSEPSIQSVLKQGGTKAEVASKLIDCIAKAMVKDGDPAGLKKYVQGKVNLQDVGGKVKGSASQVKSDTQTCAQSAIQNATKSS